MYTVIIPRCDTYSGDGAALGEWSSKYPCSLVQAFERKALCAVLYCSKYNLMGIGLSITCPPVAVTGIKMDVAPSTVHVVISSAGKCLCTTGGTVSTLYRPGEIQVYSVPANPTINRALSLFLPLTQTKGRNGVR